MRKILFLLEDYNHFYTNEANKLISNKAFVNYQAILNNLISRKHYQSDSMAHAFSEEGYETEIVVPEANPLQKLWLKENKPTLLAEWKIKRPIRSIRSRLFKHYRKAYNSIQFKTLLEQIKKSRPDVIYFYSNIYITEKQMNKLKRLVDKVVLQWSCPIWKEFPKFPYHKFDLIITASIQLKEYFNKNGSKCIYIQQAFDERVLTELQKASDQEKGDLVFIGSFSLGHYYRFEILEYLMKNNVSISIHGTGKDYLPKDSLVYKNLKEPLYGISMYEEYQKYRMAIHIHTTGNANDGINWDKFAGAKRLFEITGVGTLLLTSDQENIKDLFELDKEVVSYKNKEDLLSKITTLKANKAKIDEISECGRSRTLRDHTFKNRVREILQNESI